jgi:hypothetical protein
MFFMEILPFYISSKGRGETVPYRNRCTEGKVHQGIYAELVNKKY